MMTYWSALQTERNSKAFQYMGIWFMGVLAWPDMRGVYVILTAERLQRTHDTNIRVFSMSEKMRMQQPVLRDEHT